MTTAAIGDTHQATTIAQHWIDGCWRDSPEHNDSINPATGEVIGRYAVAGENEAREAVAAAVASFRQTNWKGDRALRSRVLLEMAERFDAHAGDLIQLLSLETGKVAPEATFEVSFAASGLDTTARSCSRSMAALPNGRLDTSHSSFANRSASLASASPGTHRSLC
jgi:acyl-CoA reductase-like NAD-dependent aldehyde dehydrogenase